MGLADTGSLESDCGARCTHIGEVPGPALIRPDEQQAPVPRARHLATMPHTGSLTALAGAQMRRHFILQYVAREVPADVPDTLRSLAQAARDLIQGRRTHHPELLLFTSWPTLREYAEHDPTASGLQPFANLVDEHGPDAILQAVEQLAPESTAQVTVSTVHKAKGREWSHVRITPDFPPPPETDVLDEAGRPIPGPVNGAEARLAYVAVTRARRHLDPAGLAWIHHHPDNPRGAG